MFSEIDYPGRFHVRPSLDTSSAGPVRKADELGVRDELSCGFPAVQSVIVVKGMMEPKSREIFQPLLPAVD